MANWRFTIDIKAIIREKQSSDDPEISRAKAKKIADLLETHLKLHKMGDDEKYDLEFNVIEEFKSAAEADDDYALDHINMALHMLYNWGDDNRVWFGL